MKNTIKCPKCGHEFPASEGLVAHLKEEATLEAEKKIRAEVEDEKGLELQDLKKELQEQKDKNDEYRKNELELREKSRKLEEEKKDFELEKQRELDRERETIISKAQEEQSEKDKYKFDEYEKRLKDMQNLVDEMKRKGTPGSQQLQGEVGELDLEDTLIKLFPTDEISEVKKGELGGDVRQIVKTLRGTDCGLILWERKRTKTWDEKWGSKLKDDMRRDGAVLGVIVTEVLPKDQKKEIDNRNGVWVTTPSFAEPVAKFLRQNLYDVAKNKAIKLNKQSKAEDLYDYVTSHEFIDQIERMAGVYFEMRGQITKERVVAEKQWKQREMQVDGLLKGVSGMYGGMQLIAGTALPQVKSLEAPEEKED